MCPFNDVDDADNKLIMEMCHLNVSRKGQCVCVVRKKKLKKVCIC